MGRIRTLIGRYDTAIWIRVLGTVLTTLAGFMLKPFLIFYLYDKLDGAVLMSMVILGLQSASGILMNLWGGGLTDRYGRKPLMMAALVVEMLSMVGFMFADTVWQFAIFATLNGMGMALFFPAANAQVADVVPEERRAEVFALLHTALNVGAAAGPLLGLAVFTYSPKLSFAISACAFLVYSLLVWWKVPETLPADVRKSSLANKAPRLSFREHRNLYVVTFFALPVGMLYATVESNFPLHLQEHFADYKTVYATLMTINGTIVILFQMWVAKFTESFARHKVIFASYLLFTVVAIGYGFAPAFLFLVLSEIAFTMGEMMNGPHMQKTISLMAPPEMRGRYFSIMSMNWQVSRAIGPFLGGLVLTRFGGEVLFVILGVWLIVCGIAQFRLIRTLQSKEQSIQAVGNPAVVTAD